MAEEEKTERKTTAAAERPVEELDQEIEDLRRQVEEARSSSNENLNLAKRIQADFDNYKKRALKERDDVTKSANDKLLGDMLSTVDDLERAAASDVSAEEMRAGIKQILTNLRSLLASYGVKEMPQKGDFDPNLHEALCTGQGEDGKVLETLQKGYYVGSRVLRHAKVMVGKQENQGDGDNDG